MTPLECYVRMCATDNPIEWIVWASNFVSTAGTYIINDDHGWLAGFLYKHPNGQFLFSVRPDMRRRGLGHRLLDMAQPLDFERTQYSELGRLCVDSYLRRATPRLNYPA